MIYFDHEKHCSKTLDGATRYVSAGKILASKSKVLIWTCFHYCVWLVLPPLSSVGCTFCPISPALSSSVTGRLGYLPNSKLFYSNVKIAKEHKEVATVNSKFCQVLKHLKIAQDFYNFAKVVKLWRIWSRCSALNLFLASFFTGLFWLWSLTCAFFCVIVGVVPTTQAGYAHAWV